MIAISRHYLSQNLLEQTYNSHFYAHITHGCQLLGQNEDAIEHIITQQKTAIRLMSFAHYQANASPLFKNLNVIELTDIVKNSNLLFTHNTINKNSPVVFNNIFLFNETSHPHQTVNSLTSTYSIPTGSLKLPIYRTEAGRSSIKYICSNTWNSTLKVLSTANIKK